jgi:hypothetical protein
MKLREMWESLKAVLFLLFWIGVLVGIAVGVYLLKTFRWTI